MAITQTLINVKNDMTAIEASMACKSAGKYLHEGEGTIFVLDPDWKWRLKDIRRLVSDMDSVDNIKKVTL